VIPTRRVLVTVAALVAAGVAAVASPIGLPPAPAEAQASATTPPPASLCPELTDSITRLYLALLNRQPDRAGFESFVAAYQSGQKNLTQISEELIASQEFQLRALINDDQFIMFVIGQTTGLPPTPEQEQYWTETLSTGYPRGLMLLMFTESEEYVNETGTAPPLAGYLNWYPVKTQWRCNIGSARYDIAPLAGEEVYADHIIYNSGDESEDIRISTLNNDGSVNTQLLYHRLGAGFTDYTWGGQFRGNGSYGVTLEVQAESSTAWSVVFYSRSIGDDRPGWQLL